MRVGALGLLQPAAGRRDQGVLGGDADPAQGGGHRGGVGGRHRGDPLAEDDEFETNLTRAAEALRDSLEPNGGWPGFLVSGWLAAAVMHRTEWFYESARIQFTLAERVDTMSAADVAWMLAALRRVGADTDESLMTAARRRLDETQRSDGAWPSDDAPAFDVHTTLTALRALL